jgi:hypothetical protein
MITVFWGCEEAILVDAKPREETINSDTYIRKLTELGTRFKQVVLSRIQHKSIATLYIFILLTVTRGAQQ